MAAEGQLAPPESPVPAEPLQQAPPSQPAVQPQVREPSQQAAQPQPVQQQAAAPGWRDHLKSQGYDLSGIQDDAAAAQYIGSALKQAQQAMQYARYGQEVAPHYDEFQKWRQEQQRQAQAQQQGQKPWWAQDPIGWNPPEYDPGWASLVARDAQGNLVPMPGAPANVVQKYQEYMLHRQQTADKFMSNPHAFIEPTVRHLAKQIAEQAIQEHLGQYKDMESAKSFVQQHASWLHQLDGGGQPMRNPVSGELMLSPWGERFKVHVQQAQDYGMNQQAQQEWAMTKVQMEYAAQELQRLQSGGGQNPPVPVNPREQANQEALDKNRGKRNNQANNTAARQPAGDLPLDQQLRAAFSAAGYSMDQRLE